MRKQKGQPATLPIFAGENEETAWWASPAGRKFLKKNTAKRTLEKGKGSPLVAKLARVNSVQIALRLPEPDVSWAREIAGRKGIGYQTLLKMLVHEGLRREARRQ